MLVTHHVLSSGRMGNNRAGSHFETLNLRVAETCGMAVFKCSEGCSERFLQLNVEDKKRYIASYH